MKNYSRNHGLLYLHPAVTVVLLTFFGVAAYLIWSISKTTDQEEVPPSPTTTSAPADKPATRERMQQVQTTSTEGMKPPRPDVEDTVLSDIRRMVPGEVAAKWLYYRSKTAKTVKIAGAWDGWGTKTELIPVSNGLWAFPIAKVVASFGSYEFKFILDGEWESGANRLLHLNEEGLMEAPPNVVSQILIEHPHQIRTWLLTAPEDIGDVKVTLDPDHGELKLRWQVPEKNPSLAGYRMAGEDVEFVLDPSTYSLSPDAMETAAVAGTFNGWNPSDPSSQLSRQPDDTWTVRISYGFIDSKTTDPELLFKFVVNGDWQNPPQEAPNAMLEPGTPHMNLSLPRHGAARPELLVQTQQPIDLRSPPIVTIEGLHERKIRLHPSPGAIMDTLYSDLPMGVTLDRESPATIYRLFAPRATKVQLGLFDGPYHTTPDDDPVEPMDTIDMTRLNDGAWEYRQEGLHIGQYYAFRVEGPHGNGEGFNPNRWLGDPYAKAVSLAEGNSIVVDLTATKAPWSGWSEAARNLRIPWEDQIIYETHVRHFTMDESSGVQADLRGNYLGILATEGLGTGLDHLKSLGVNVIQFLPIHEFPNGFEGRHDWGYATDFFFAPESSFAQHPREGSQVWEFRHLVNELKEQGFAVFLDVVYNHIGGVNIFNAIDRKYYFRLNPDFTNMNFSGVGNDVASERPMMRRLIVENILFWVEEYGIDGFRFDLGELIDDATLLQIEREIRAKHPHVVLHSEPWSFRGHHKDFIGGTSWGAWNDAFREPAKRFVVGGGDKERLKQAVRGSVETWTRHPLQSVNYMESHDDYSLVDELSLNPGRDGRELSERDERIHKLAATLIMGSLGVPMITEGQAFLRSKHGIRNTYNRGDALNALRWDERDRPHAKEVLGYYKQMIAFRQSDAGRALRVSDAPSMDYLQFIDIDGASDTGLGWILNANQERPNVPAVLILMNAGMEEVTFDVPLPAGVWGQIGNGSSVIPEGIPGTPKVIGGRSHSISVPPQTALLYRSGFY